MLIVFVIILITLGAFFILLRRIKVKMQKAVLYGLLFFVLPLLPFLPLGNIAPRYDYLASFGIIFIGIYFLQFIYSKVAVFSKYVALALILCITGIYCVINIVQLNKTNNDWQKAGNITNNTITALNTSYTPTLLNNNSIFYFYNIPTRYGDAWVFPVGLSDAICFTFHNQNVTVRTDIPLQVALDTTKR